LEGTASNRIKALTFKSATNHKNVSSLISNKGIDYNVLDKQFKNNINTIKLEKLEQRNI
jgi:hypothetical protein